MDKKKLDQQSQHWDKNFSSKPEMFGVEASVAATSSAKIFKEKNVKKRILERDALQIRQDLNTSSMESHLNRIRKKLKKISSNFTISSKDKYVYLEITNQDK